MKKAFCDLCEAPALKESDLKLFAKFPIGPDNETNTDVFAVTANFHLKFTKHPTGFGGPPDLCASCLSQIAERMAEKARDL